MKCFYHRMDLDGQCSGAIVKLKFPLCEMIPYNYGEKFPWDQIKEEEIVFLVDLHLQPFNDMIKLSEKTRLFWIDHHRSSMEDYEKNKEKFLPKNGKVVISMKESACVLTWYFLFPNTPLPKSIWLLGKYDVFDLEIDDRVLDFQYGMKGFNTNPCNTEFWKSLILSDPESINNQIENISKIGSFVRKCFIKEEELIAKQFSFTTEFEGYKCIACNSIRAGSMFFDSVFDKDKHDLRISFGLMSNGKWTVSLYCEKEEIDVSELAKKYGGGGHRGASGFQCDKLPFKI